MLVPLQLPGWPEASDPPVLATLGLLVGLPALAFAIIALLGKASALAKAGRSDGPRGTDPVWLNGAPATKELTPGTATDSTSASGTGGASARW